jgi:hypothetical protein
VHRYRHDGEDHDPGPPFRSTCSRGQAAGKQQVQVSSSGDQGITGLLFDIGVSVPNWSLDRILPLGLRRSTAGGHRRACLKLAARAFHQSSKAFPRHWHGTGLQYATKKGARSLAAFLRAHRAGLLLDEGLSPETMARLAEAASGFPAAVDLVGPCYAGEWGAGVGCPPPFELQLLGSSGSPFSTALHHMANLAPRRVRAQVPPAPWGLDTRSFG